jgi:copper(I)-binding protein
MSLKSVFAIAVLLASSFASAHSFKIGNLEIEHPHARATIAGQNNGAAYMQIENNGKTDDKLISASSPAAANVEVHSMSMDGDVMKMRAVDSLEIKAGAQVTMKPGEGYHIMLLGLKKPLQAGDKFPMTLTFSKAGKVKIIVHVSNKEMHAKPSENKDEMDQHEHHNH